MTKEYVLTEQDYNIKYRDTWAGLRDKKTGEIHPIKIVDSKVDSDGVIVFRTRIPRNNTSFSNKIFPVDDENLVLSYPKTGAINLSSGFVVLVNRKCLRQWRESPNNDTSAIIDPFREERDKVNEWLCENYSSDYTLKLNTRVDGNGIGHIQLLKDIYNNIYYSPIEAIEEVSSCRRIACAFDKDWFIGIKHTADKPLLFKKEHVVGTVEGDSFLLPKHVDFLKEELSTFGLEVNVI